jgi:HSP20 family protein
MSIRDMVPRVGRRRPPATGRADSDLFAFHRGINRLFDDFFQDFGLGPAWTDREGGSGGFVPAVNMSETDKELRIAAELPGMDEADVNVELDEDAVTIRGEKRSEHEDSRENWYCVEQTQGRFERVVPLPLDVDTDKAKATFKKGVLTITLPKRPDVESKRKRIAITAG